jgi:tRNA-dihydrouridine synthase 3
VQEQLGFLTSDLSLQLDTVPALGETGTLGTLPQDLQMEESALGPPWPLSPLLVLSCPSQEPATPCAFGDRCRFLHDVGRYLETKPADLGPRCVLFETFGRCPFSMTCRFAGAHLGPEGQNLVQEEVVARCAQLPSVRNGLDRALQQQLRKRQVCFERAEQALNRLTQSPMPTVVPETTVAMATPKQNSCHAQLDTVGGAGTPQSSPVPTCGPLTDEDVIRLRPCEKKRVRCRHGNWIPALSTVLS